MTKLMKLELKRMNLRPYLLSSVVFGIVLLVFIYFVANVAQLEQEADFMNYSNIFLFIGAISILLFGVFSAAMYARLITNEYTGKRLTVLFSYPVSRKKIFFSKILIVLCFVFISMLLCTSITFMTFALTETFSPIVTDTLSTSLLLEVIRMDVTSLCLVNAAGLLALRIGFIKKSVSVTLISSFVLSGFGGNIAIGAAKNPVVSLTMVLVSLAVIFLVPLTMSAKIDQMEVE